MWYEVYRGSGRPTGRTSDECPVYPDGRPDESWFFWSGTDAEFQREFEWGIHDTFHEFPNLDCEFCNPV